MANFKCKVTYANAEHKKISELYLVLAMSYSEAEEIISTEFASFDVIDLTITKYNICEPYINDGVKKYFKCRVNFIDEGGKKHPVDKLIQSETMDGAKSFLIESMRGSLSDYTIEKIEETKILDIYQ